MGRPRKSFLSDDNNDVNPMHHHQAELVTKEAERKANKPKIISESYEMIISSFGKRKYVKVSRLENGSVYRTSASKQDYDNHNFR